MLIMWEWRWVEYWPPWSVTKVSCVVHSFLSRFQATASGNTSVIQNSGAVPLMVGMSGSLASLQPQVTVLPQSVTAASATSPNPTPINTSNLPQMLFLNQVTMNGQTSFVLVDANNKPVQLPQGQFVNFTVLCVLCGCVGGFTVVFCCCHGHQCRVTCCVESDLDT